MCYTWDNLLIKKSFLSLFYSLIFFISITFSTLLYYIRVKHLDDEKWWWWKKRKASEKCFFISFSISNYKLEQEHEKKWNSKYHMRDSRTLEYSEYSSPTRCAHDLFLIKIRDFFCNIFVIVWKILKIIKKWRKESFSKLLKFMTLIGVISQLWKHIFKVLSFE